MAYLIISPFCEFRFFRHPLNSLIQLANLAVSSFLRLRMFLLKFLKGVIKQLFFTLKFRSQLISFLNTLLTKSGQFCTKT